MFETQSDNFDTDPVTYHKYTAYVLARLAGLVYKFKNKQQLLADAQDPHAKFNSVSAFGRRGNKVFIFENEECIVVVWTGTSRTQDWNDNLTVTLKPFTINGVNGKIKKGFWRHTDRAWMEGAEGGVSVKLQQLTSGNNRKVFFTGHSLGGACALVSACRFIKEQNGLQKVAQIVTTGQPRTLCKRIAKYISAELKDKYFRFVDSGDPVPQFLGRVLRHAGTLKFINRGRSPVIYTDPSILVTGLRTLRSMLIFITIFIVILMPNTQLALFVVFSTAKKYIENCKEDHHAFRYVDSVRYIEEK